MSSNEAFDFWYAVNNTEIVVHPRQRLETFGSTTLRYHLVAEVMDEVDRVRVREGRIHAFRPQIITPDALAQTMLEGFGEEEAQRYVDWLRGHEAHLVLLKYGFSVRKESVNEHIVTDSIDNVIDRVRQDVEASPDPLHALIRGVDEPWEVCLLSLLVDVVQQSALSNARDLQRDPGGIGHQIDRMFREASRDPARIPALSEFLHRHKRFRDYEDRFFALVRSSRS